MGLNISNNSRGSITFRGALLGVLLQACYILRQEGLTAYPLETKVNNHPRISLAMPTLIKSVLQIILQQSLDATSEKDVVQAKSAAKMYLL